MMIYWIFGKKVGSKREKNHQNNWKKKKVGCEGEGEGTKDGKKRTTQRSVKYSTKTNIIKRTSVILNKLFDENYTNK